jgi:hypothetical protein
VLAKPPAWISDKQHAQELNGGNVEPLAMAASDTKRIHIHFYIWYKRKKTLRAALDSNPDDFIKMASILKFMLILEWSYTSEHKYKNCPGS